MVTGPEAEEAPIPPTSNAVWGRERGRQGHNGAGPTGILFAVYGGQV